MKLITTFGVVFYKPSARYVTPLSFWQGNLFAIATRLLFFSEAQFRF